MSADKEQRVIDALRVVFFRKGTAEWPEIQELRRRGWARMEDFVFYVTEAGAYEVIRRIPATELPPPPPLPKSCYDEWLERQAV